MARTRRRRPLGALARALVVLALAGSTVALSGPRPPGPADGGRPPSLDPRRFTTRIDNPFWPMAPGRRWVYRETGRADGTRRVEVTVTDRTATVLGVEARVVRDIVFEGGRPLEATDDWYAQDAEGNLWQLGEVRQRYGAAGASTAGSWEAGVDGAQPVLVLPSDPEAGTVYRQPDAVVQVLSAAAAVRVPYGVFGRLLVTQESAPEEPEEVEREFYARGVGPVLAVTVSGGSGREELVGFAGARSAGTATGR